MPQNIRRDLYQIENTKGVIGMSLDYLNNCEWYDEHYSKIIYEDEEIFVLQRGEQITVINKADVSQER